MTAELQNKSHFVTEGELMRNCAFKYCEYLLGDNIEDSIARQRAVTESGINIPVQELFTRERFKYILNQVANAWNVNKLYSDIADLRKKMVKGYETILDKATDAVNEGKEVYNIHGDEIGKTFHKEAASELRQTNKDLLTMIGKIGGTEEGINQKTNININNKEGKVLIVDVASFADYVKEEKNIPNNKKESHNV